MKLGYELKIEQSQKLVMTPELIQAIQILQYSTQELEEFVQEELLENPFLEKSVSEDNLDSEEDDIKEAQTSENDEDWAIQVALEEKYDDISYRQNEKFYDRDEFTFEQFVVVEKTLKDHLMDQLRLVQLGSTSYNIASYIIESLDDNGYMTLTVEELTKYFGKTEERIKSLIKLIQSFEPAGVAAMDLRQCLKLQLKRRGLLTKLISIIINSYLDDIADNKLAQVAKKLGIGPHEVQKISDLIRTLEPKPGREFASETATKYIVVDVILEKIGSEYEVRLNDDSVPRLMISSYYEKVQREAEGDAEVSDFLTNRFNSAVWLIKSIEQRKSTIKKVATAIVEHQKDFFDSGIKHLKPLTLKQIAQDIGVHESTVSRAVNGKYMQTPMGVFEMKYFFSSGASVSSDESLATEGIKSIIRDIIAKENPNMPYSDQSLCELLKKESIDISRRTVAKYRDEMNILSSSKRKRF
ncbi:MAG: RNA polymerase factor sigma-54 [Eubacteriales bacterium]